MRILCKIYINYIRLLLKLQWYLSVQPVVPKKPPFKNYTSLGVQQSGCYADFSFSLKKTEKQSYPVKGTNDTLISDIIMQPGKNLIENLFFMFLFSFISCMIILTVQ